MVRDRRTRRRVPRLQVRDADGRPLSRRDIQMVPGPGATPETRARLRGPAPRARGD